MGSLYVIWNDVNDKLYIGITTTTIEQRFRKHIKNALRGGDTHLYRAIRKFGECVFHIECLVSNIPNERLPLFERSCIAHYDSKHKGYNMTDGGDGVLNPSDDIRQKMSRAKRGHIPWNKGTKGVMKAWNKGLPMTEERKQHLSEVHKGRKLTNETKKKISISGKGRKPWNKGVPAWNRGKPMSEAQRKKMKWEVTEETKKKISLALKGRTVWNKGRKMSEEEKDKIRVAHLGKKMSEETKQKIGNAHRGKRVSEETRKKMREAALKRYGHNL